VKRMRKFTDEQISQANQISVLELSKQLGYLLEKRGSNYHIKDHGGFYISDTKNSFYCWAEQSGGGPVQFLMFTQKINWVESMKHLIGEGQTQQSDNIGMRWKKPLEQKPAEFKLPDKAETSYKRLFAYLLKTRGLDKDIVGDLVIQKKIYESSPHHNVVFVGYDEKGQARQAFQRGTVTGITFKGEVSGSNKNYCFTMEGKGESLTVYEAAIDAISHASMFKQNGLGWKKEHRLALGCLSDNSLEGYLKQHPEIKKIAFALDNDFEAKYSNGSPAPNWGQQAAEKLADKYLQLGYTTNIEKPMSKDWNEDLLSMYTLEKYTQKQLEEKQPQENTEEFEEAM